MYVWLVIFRASVSETGTDQVLTKAGSRRIEHFVSEGMVGHLNSHATVITYEKWSG
jgi:hypothetical protein